MRTTHPFLHPTKGWRNFARSAGTNRRRKLVHQGWLLVPRSAAWRIAKLRWDPSRANLAKERALYEPMRMNNGSLTR